MSIIQQLEDLKEWAQNPERYERRLAFRSNNPMGTEAGTIPIEWDELSDREQEYYRTGPWSTREDYSKGQLVQPGPGYKPGGLVEPGVMNYGKEDKLGKNISYIKEAKHYNYKKPVYRFSITFPPGMKKNEVNMVREATPENLKMMKKLRNKLQGEIDTFYGPNRITTEDVLKLRDKHPTLTNKQIAEKLKGKIGARGHPFTESSVKKATIDAGKKGKYGKLTSLGRTLEQLKEEAIKLPLGKKYLDDYNKTKNKDEALKVFRDRIKTGLHRHFTADPAKAATWRAKWAKTEKGALSIKKSLEKQSALRTAVYGNFNPGRDPEHRLFHALWRSSQQAGSRWKLISKKPDKWTRETSRGAKFLDTKNKKPITLDGLKKYMDTTPDVGSYKVALKPFKEKAALQKYLVNYKGKEYKLGNLLNERLWTGDDWKYFSEGTSEIVVNHPDKVKDNWWKGEVVYKDANMRLNDLERTFASQMRRADTDIDRQKVLKKNLAKDIKRLGPITYKGPHGAFGTKPTPSAVIKSMVKPMYKKTGDKALSRTLNTLVKQIGCGGRLASQGGGDVDCFTKGKNLVNKGEFSLFSKAQKMNLAKLANQTYKLGRGIMKYGIIPEAIFVAGESLVRMGMGDTLEEGLKSAVSWIPGLGHLEDEATQSRLERRVGKENAAILSNVRNVQKRNEAVEELKRKKQAALNLNAQGTEFTHETDAKIRSRYDQQIKEAEANASRASLGVTEAETIKSKELEDTAVDVGGTQNKFLKWIEGSENAFRQPIKDESGLSFDLTPLPRTQEMLNQKAKSPGEQFPREFLTMNVHDIVDWANTNNVNPQEVYNYQQEIKKAPLAELADRYGWESIYGFNLPEPVQFSAPRHIRHGNYAGGGIATLHPRRPGALPPPSGPDSQGLAYLNNYATKRTE